MDKILFNNKYLLRDQVLKGYKTMTRRILPIPQYMQILMKERILTEEDKLLLCEKFSRYKVGDEVAIAQSYSDILAEYSKQGKTNALYKSLCDAEVPGSKNSMFVKADLMPHRIKITNVTVELLQDISDDDCLKEGVDRCEKEWGYWQRSDNGSLNFYAFENITDAFATLINKVCGKGTWDLNPYVLVYSFKLIK